MIKCVTPTNERLDPDSVYLSTIFSRCDALR